MPVARYFLFVGGVLLALLLAIDSLVPQQAIVASQAAPSVNKTVVRIRSDQKLPERVVYDTSLPTIVPPTVTAQAVAPPVPAVASAGRPGPRSGDVCPVRTAGGEEARAAGSAQAQGRQEPPGAADAVRAAAANAGGAAVAFRLLWRSELEQHLVRSAD